MPKKPTRYSTRITNGKIKVYKDPKGQLVRGTSESCRDCHLDNMDTGRAIHCGMSCINFGLDFGSFVLYEAPEEPPEGSMEHARKELRKAAKAAAREAVGHNPLKRLTSALIGSCYFCIAYVTLSAMGMMMCASLGRLEWAGEALDQIGAGIAGLALSLVLLWIVESLSESTTEAETPEGCKCSFRGRALGDGCQHCNPELAAELAAELTENDTEEEG